MKGSAANFVASIRSVLKDFEPLSYDERRNKLSSWRTPLPSFLYHYRGHSGPNDERNLRDMLVDSHFYLRSPRDFNDPFECRFQFGKLGDTVAVYDYLVRTAVAQGANPAVGVDIAAGMVKVGRDGIAKIAANDTEARLQAVGIYCWAESHKNVLMWAHYGQSHRGVCVEFDVAHGIHTLGMCRKVEYDGPMPTLDYPEPDINKIITPMFRKAKQWGYEEEWRIAIPSGSHQHLDFPPAAVTSIIYGCEAEPGTHALVSKLLKERSNAGLPAVKERKVVRAEREYILVDV